MIRVFIEIGVYGNYNCGGNVVVVHTECYVNDSSVIKLGSNDAFTMN